MFASSLPLHVSFHVMDIFLVEGLEFIFRLGLALLEHSHDRLLELDMEDMTKVGVMATECDWISVHVLHLSLFWQLHTQ